MSDFTWIPIYEELAKKLLEYKDRRKELIEFIFSDAGLKEFSGYLHLENKTQIIDDIDPFSFMGMFNRGSLAIGKRKAILGKIKEKLNLDADIPSDFDGIPVLRYSRMFFYDWNDFLESCNILWDSYEKMMNGSLESWFNYYKFKTRKAECTMPLFWCKPEDYIALDSRNTEYLKQKGIDVDINDAASYLNLLQTIKDKMASNELTENSFAEISYNAWDYSNQKKTQYWIFAPGEKADRWNEFYKTGVMALGWDEVQDLKKYATKEDVRSVIKNIYNRETSATNDALANWQFANEIKTGDIVFAKEGLYKIIGRGVVAGEYEYKPEKDEYRHIRKVHWSNKGEWEAPFKLPQKTLTNITNLKEKVKQLESLFDPEDAKINEGKITYNKYGEYVNLLKNAKNIILQGAPGTGKTYSTAEIALSVLGYDTTQYQSHEELMKVFNDLRLKIDSSSGNVLSGQIGFVTFHQSMDYEDFVEGIKPKTDGMGNVIYNVEDGIFKTIANKAKYKKSSNFENAYTNFITDISDYEDEKPFKLKTRSNKEFAVTVNGNNNLSLYTGKSFRKNGVLTKTNIIKQIQGEEKFKGWEGYFFGVIDYLAAKYGYKEQTEKQKNYVLIIDEINRGNVSKIFGELITLLEADKRSGGEHSLHVILPYSTDEFEVPSNLYIIGTMNTTDRSVGNIDYAVRRRFSFITLPSSREVVAEKCGEDSKSVLLFDAVKNFLEKNKIEMDIDDLMVGHSYFFAETENELKLKWKYNILPLLREYFKDGIIRKNVAKDCVIDTFINDNKKEQKSDNE